MHNRASLTLGLGIMIIAGYAVITATHWPAKAALFPLVIGIPVVCLAAIETLWSLLRPGKASDQAMDFKLAEDLPEQVQSRRTVAAISWILGFFAAILLLGFPIAVPLFAFAYVKFAGREGWIYSLIFALVVAGLFYLIFDRFLHVPFPVGWIPDWLGIT